MSEKFNPADKLTLPEPPSGCFWRVYSCVDLGPRIELRQYRRKFKINYSTRVSERGYLEWNWQTKEIYPVDRGLELAAETIMEEITRLQDYRSQVDELYSPKVYLDDLVNN